MQWVGTSHAFGMTPGSLQKEYLKSQRSRNSLFLVRSWKKKKERKEKKGCVFFFLILVWLYYLCLNFWLTGHVLWGEMCDGGFFPLLVRKLVVSTPCFLKLFEMRPLVINYVLTTYMSSISFFKWENRSLLLNARWLSMLFQKSSGWGDLREMTGFLTVWQMGRGENV